MVDKYGPDGAGVQKPQQPKQKLHIVKFSLNIGEQDKQRHLQKARTFLEERNQVRLVLQLKGREKSRPQVAEVFFAELVASLQDVSSVNSPMKPGVYQVTLNPAKRRN